MAPENHENHPGGPSALPSREEKRPAPRHPLRWLLLGTALVTLVLLGWVFGRGWVREYFSTEYTDDAFVNGHVSFISPRVAGTVVSVYVDDNDRVRAGDLLIELDHEPYQVAVDLKKAALDVAEANVKVAMAQVRSQEALARASWFSLVNAQEQVRFQIASLHANVANLRLQEANLDLARKETARVQRLVQQQAAAREELEQRVANEEVARQSVINARETIRKNRAALGLPPNDENPTQVPPDLEQNFSAVQVALSNASQALAQIGVPLKLYQLTPERLHKQLLDMDPAGDLNRTLDRFVEESPAVAQSRAARDQARQDLRNAQLNLDYTYVYAPIEGQVARRSVNPGNKVAVGQSLMAVRSLTNIWIDANFKETQLGNLRIGLPVDVHVDAYPARVFRGRVQGFSAGTGSSLALIPPENATGNYVKIVQRLTVRITIDPEDRSEDTPLFIGLSVEPYVRIKEQPTGPDAGQRLLAPIQPSLRRPVTPAPMGPTGTVPGTALRPGGRSP